MLTYIIRRLLWSVLLLFVVSFVVFLVFYTLPSSDPALLRAGRNPDPALVKILNKRYGLDKPFYVQFWFYIKALVLHFDFGRSYQNNVDVRPYIFERLPATISLAIGGAVVWLLVGIPIGIIAAVKRGTWIEKVAMGIALVGISAPVYWLGLVSIYLFSTDIGKFPIFDATGNYANLWDNPSQWFSSLILPWLVLATTFAAVYARFMRSNLVDVLDEDYIRTARAKGLKERNVVFRHGVRSAITPIITIFGLDLGILFGGAILTETVFNIPGIGRTAFDAIQKSDLPIVQGTVLIGAMAIILFNLFVDVLYAFVDPRVRY
ncbi:MAG: peptide/nickel transport system permease protein [Solirubrobacteraceae bacterium]|nr:peptide/nickel transport system permease protein [Solirubrobacteraceae bacterium]